jgi:hypothetical protein
VDRARAQSVNIMNRCINALRKLQTERGIRSQAFPETDVPAGLGLMDIRQVAKTKPMDTDAEPEASAPPEPAAPTPTGFDALMALADKQLAQRYRDYGMAAFTGAPVGQVPDLPSSPKHVSDPARTEAQSQPNNLASSPKHVSDLIRTEAQSQTSNLASSPKHVSDLIRTEAQSQTNNLASSPKHVSDLIRTEAQSQTNNQWSMGSNCKPAAAPTPAPAKPAPSSPKQPLPGLIRTEPGAQMRTNGRRNTPRNAPCPCNSGQKFKRCCGNGALEANSPGLSDRKPGSGHLPGVDRAA